MRVQQLFDLSNKTALVTGGGRGIGRFIAKGLAEAGATVFIASRKLENCQTVVDEIKADGGKSIAVKADVGKKEDIDALADQVLDQTDHLNILVNNAGIVWAAPTLEYPVEAWDKVFNVNVRGLWLLSQRMIVHMKEKGGGSIIHVASTSAFRGAPEEEQPVIAYNASKGAVVALTTDMGVKLGVHKIRVTAIAPGPFMTDMMTHVTSDEDKLDDFNRGIPLRRSGSENDMKGVAVFLASDASAYMTGQTILVDGGMISLARS